MLMFCGPPSSGVIEGRLDQGASAAIATVVPDELPVPETTIWTKLFTHNINPEPGITLSTFCWPAVSAVAVVAMEICVRGGEAACTNGTMPPPGTSVETPGGIGPGAAVGV